MIGARIDTSVPPNARIFPKFIRIVATSIVERQPGGKYGGKSVISKHGEKLILLYEQLEREMNEIVQQKFDEIFLHGDWLKKSNLQGDMGDT